MIFKKIAIIPNQTKDADLLHTKNIINYFERKNIQISIDEQYEKYLDKSEFVRYAKYEELFERCDLIIALGGDGTILKISGKASVQNIPVIGINLGTIGYMSEIEVDEIFLLDNLIDDKFTIEHRMMIDVSVEKKEGGVIFTGSALNDAVITKGIVSRLIEISLMCNGALVTKYRADGVIIATPTGSTAYSMSAGGPIIDPALECFCVTPICPHTLLSRTLLFSHDSVLEINDINPRNSDVYLTVDGEKNIKLNRGDTVKITKSRYFTKLLNVKDNGFFDVMRKISG